MATTKTEDTKKVRDGDELVEYHCPEAFSEHDDHPVYASVNGDNVVIQRGETVMIKRKFVEVIENSLRQKKAARDARKRAKMAAHKPYREL